MNWRTYLFVFIITILSISGCNVKETPSEQIQHQIQEDQPPAEQTESQAPVEQMEEQQIQPSSQAVREIENQSLQKSVRKVIHDGDFIVSEGTVTIHEQNLTLKGNLIVNGTGKLIVTDSELHFQQEYNQQYRAYIRDNASLEMHNVQLRTDGKWFNFQYNNNASVNLDNVHGEDCCIPWHGSSENVQFNIKNSTVGITVNENVKVHAEDSSLFFELVLMNVSGMYELPAGHVNQYNLVIPQHARGDIELHITNSTFTDWGTTLDRDTDITFVNSKMTIGLNAGSDWSNPEHQSPQVKVSGLKTKTYDDFSIVYDTNKLKLVNTSVRDWYPQAWNKAVVEISNSDLADLQSNGGTANLIIRNSTALIAIARERVTYKFYDSVIKQDAIAHDDARIYLHNTEVKGEIKEIGNGKVFVSD